MWYQKLFSVFEYIRKKFKKVNVDIFSYLRDILVLPFFNLFFFQALSVRASALVGYRFVNVTKNQTFMSKYGLFCHRKSKRYFGRFFYHIYLRDISALYISKICLPNISFLKFVHIYFFLFL
jgi:hypothetical protein